MSIHHITHRRSQPHFLTAYPTVMSHSSVTEVNVGIICACTCVIFPLMKTVVAKSQAICFSLRGPHRKSNMVREHYESTLDTSLAEHGLLEIPKIAMTEPISLVSGGRSGKKGKNSPREKTKTGIVRTLDIEIGPDLELQSVDMGYHAHIISGTHHPRR